MKKIISTNLIFAFLAVPLSLHAQNLLDYTHYPITAIREVPPNILVMLDNSVSMNRAAYEDLVRVPGIGARSAARIVAT